MDENIQKEVIKEIPEIIGEIEKATMRTDLNFG